MSIELPWNPCTKTTKCMKSGLNSLSKITYDS
jgi:hypothetical protein